MATDAQLEGLSTAVGMRVREARLRRGLTLDQLAERSGVSRRMIINVEGGSANASITTLLRLSSALQVSLASLVSNDIRAGATTITRSDAREPLWHGEAGGTATLVASADMLELWEWTLHPGEVYASEAHRAGTYELLHVHAGRLLLSVGADEDELATGDGASFAADAHHSYACVGRRPVRFSMTVLEPMSRMRP